MRKDEAQSWLRLQPQFRVVRVLLTLLEDRIDTKFKRAMAKVNKEDGVYQRKPKVKTSWMGRQP